MTAITYTAKDRGKLVSSHTAGLIYSFDVDLKGWLPKASRKIKQATSLSGVVETLLHREDETVDILTAPIKDVFLEEQLNEFFSSVMGGESFEIDLHGSTSAENDPQNATLKGDFTASRQGLNNTPSFRFTILL